MIQRNNIINDEDINNLIYNTLPAFLFTKDTKLPVDIIIFENNFLKYHLPLFLLFRNSYNKNIEDYIPVLISNEPVILSSKRIKILKKDFYKIYFWIIRYNKLIKQLSKQNISYLTFIKKIKNNINENYNIILEMACIMPENTGLRYKIWLDQGELYKKGGHSYRIKVQPVNKIKETTAFNTLTLDGEWIGDTVNKYSPKDKKSIEIWLNNNKQLIKDLADKKITFNDFLLLSKKFKSKFNDNFIEDDINTLNYGSIYQYDNNYDLVINNDKQYNIINDNGELINDDWFQYIDFKLYQDNKGIYFKCIGLNDKHYKLYTNGYLYLINSK